MWTDMTKLTGAFHENEIAPNNMNTANNKSRHKARSWDNSILFLPILTSPLHIHLTRGLNLRTVRVRYLCKRCGTREGLSVSTATLQLT